jgi:hypothetical protein
VCFAVWWAIVTIELTRRLLHAGAPAASIEAALVAHAVDRVPFVLALVERSPELAGLVERELSRLPEGTPELHLVRPSRELLEELPRGLCHRLLALPLRRDPETGVVDVAALDVLDPHVAQELAFHLQSPVRVWRADLPALRAALETLGESLAPESDESSMIPPPLGLPSRVPTLRPPRTLSSNPPIPLLRRPVPHQSFPLKRSRVQAAESGFRFARSLEEAVHEFTRAESADAVAVSLVDGLEPAEVLVLAAHRDMYEARTASASLGLHTAPLGIPSGRDSVLDQAMKSGYYLGPIAPSVVHAELRARLGETVSEVYVLPIHVSGRPVLTMLVARYGTSLEATRRSDRLAAAAEQALERVVRVKRQRSERA